MQVPTSGVSLVSCSEIPALGQQCPGPRRPFGIASPWVFRKLPAQLSYPWPLMRRRSSGFVSCQDAAVRAIPQCEAKLAAGFNADETGASSTSFCLHRTGRSPHSAIAKPPICLRREPECEYNAESRKFEATFSSENENSLPSPHSLFTCNSVPCRSAIHLANANPKPEPRDSRTDLWSPR